MGAVPKLVLWIKSKKYLVYTQRAIFFSKNFLKLNQNVHLDDVFNSIENGWVR